jgi:hypothetical protein
MGPHIRFRIVNQRALQALDGFIARVMDAKRSGSFPPDEEFKRHFDEKALAYFFEPSAAELKEWEQEWFSTPVEKRHGNPALEPPWNFGSMVDAFANGEFELIGMDTMEDEGFLKFKPLAHPYGGPGCIIAAAEAFGHTVIGVDDGSGYRPYKKPTVYWIPKAKRRADGDGAL